MVIGDKFASPSHSLLQARLYDIPTFKNALSAHKETRNMLECAIFVFVVVVSDVGVLLPDGLSNFKTKDILFLLTIRRIEALGTLAEASKKLCLCRLG